MHAAMRSLRSDHRHIEGVLRVLERECDLFRRAEQPDYALLVETVDYLRSFLAEYHDPKDDEIFNLTRARSPGCARIIEEIAAERTDATMDLQALGETLRDILNDQQISRQTFDDAARGFLRHERRQIEIEEQQLMPWASALLRPVDWAGLRSALMRETALPRSRRLRERLRDQRHWIVREALADQAERSGPAQGK